MTEQQAVDLLDRVTTDLAVDPGLVAGAVSRGRRHRRRHLVGTAAVTVAVLGLTGAGLTVALSGQGGDSRGVDPAPVATDPPQQDAPAPLTMAKLVATAHQVPRTFASIIPGEITAVPNKVWDDHNPIIDFLWNGYAVRVGLTADDYVSGQRVIDPLRRCHEQGIGQPCTPGQVPGSYEQTMTWTGPREDGGVTVRTLTVYLPTGRDVTVMESNAAGWKDSPVLTSDLPLTLDQLRLVAYSDVWFE